jgi:hypothetical protein
MNKYGNTSSMSPNDGNNWVCKVYANCLSVCLKLFMYQLDWLVRKIVISLIELYYCIFICTILDDNNFSVFNTQ